MNIKISYKSKEGEAPLLKYHAMKTFMEYVRSPCIVLYFYIKWEGETVSCCSCFAPEGTVLCT
jgi:hypothetical protein